MENLIKEIVYDFYQKASADILIGHQFRKIASHKGANPLAPPMESFKSHLPRIEEFWKNQLLGISVSIPFNLINKHHYLNIRRGELDRWVVLLKETIESAHHKETKTDELDEFIASWNEKISLFQNIFHQKLINKK